VNPDQILGIDLSLSAPGIAFCDEPVVLPSPPAKSESARGPARLNFRSRQFLTLLESMKPKAVVLEAQVNSAHNGTLGMKATAELFGVLGLILWTRDIPCAEVNPVTLKVFATGSARASKEQMIESAIANGANLPQMRLSHNRWVPDHNAADAWWLWQMGVMHYCGTSRFSDEARQRVLKRIKWPRAKGEAWTEQRQ
jgi:Holliday junction resolvasome RuvABC endonuclease subunit